MYVKDGIPLSDAGFSIGEGKEKIFFPPRWLAYAKPEDLARYGIAFVPEPPASPDELEARFVGMVAARLDAFVKERGWDSLDRVLAQTGEFTADRAVAQAAYDATWNAAFALLPQVRSGEIGVEQAAAQLPELTWEVADV
jgi:hypothetical protein